MASIHASGGARNKRSHDPIVIPDVERDYRPACPECGSTDTISHGIDRLCKHCKRRFSKVKRERLVRLISDGLDIRCPSCGETGPVSNGRHRWLCPYCGRQWMKMKQ